MPALQSAQTREAVRFFLVALAGLIVDIGVAWLLIARAAAPDPLAGAAGFATATVFNYFAHQFWTFSSGPRAASLRRFLGFSGAVAIAFVVRLAVLYMLAGMLPGPGIEAPIRLSLAACASFVVAFTLSRRMVFNPSTTHDPSDASRGPGARARLPPMR